MGTQRVTHIAEAKNFQEIFSLSNTESLVHDHSDAIVSGVRSSFGKVIEGEIHDLLISSSMRRAKAGSLSISGYDSSNSSIS